MRSRDDLCLIVNGVRKKNTVTLSAVFSVQIALRQSTPFFFALPANLQFVVHFEKTK